MARLSVSHPLARVLQDAAYGRFPRPDGTLAVMPAPLGPADAVVALTLHTVVAADVSRDEVTARLHSSDFGAPMNALFLHWLSGRLVSEPGSLDAVFAAVGAEHAPKLRLLPDERLTDHPRAVRAARYRTDVRVFTDPDERAIVAVGRGLAGRWEAGFEVEPQHRNDGLGRSIVAAIRTLIRRESRSSCRWRRATPPPSGPSSRAASHRLERRSCLFANDVEPAAKARVGRSDTTETTW